MNDPVKKSAPWKTPVIGVILLCLILAMVRLGFWQLGRADEKQTMLQALTSRSNQEFISYGLLEPSATDLRFTPVTVTGTYLNDKTVLIDRQVVQGQVGYQVFTPLRPTDDKLAPIMIARGWVPVGDSRSVLPEIDTPTGIVTVEGRLNKPPPEPPLWNDEYPVNDGMVWQFLPLDVYTSQMNLKLFPLVLELAPATASNAEKQNGSFLIDWPVIDDQWVAKHKGYAFQWFAMAVGLFIACIVLVLTRVRGAKRKNESIDTSAK